MDDEEAATPAAVGAVLARCAGLLGPVAVVADVSPTTGDSRVLDLATASGRVIAKAVGPPATYRRERTAYRRYVPALGDAAPRLLHHDDELRLLVTTRLPGRPVGGTAAAGDPEVHRRAGGLLRRLHEGSGPSRDAGYGPRLLAGYDADAAAAVEAGAVTTADADAARRLVVRAARLDPPALVPAHQDYSGRNWLLDGATLRVVDFGRTGPSPWCHDLVRLRNAEWRDRPDLEAAFLDGYGRHLDPVDDVLLAALHAVTAVWLLPYAREHRQPDLESALRDSLHRLLGP